MQMIQMISHVAFGLPPLLVIKSESRNATGE